MPTLICGVQDSDRLEGPGRTGGSYGGSVGEKVWVGDEIEHGSEFIRLVGALPDKPQEVDAVADLGRAADGCPCAEDAGDWLLLPSEAILRGDGFRAQGDMKPIMDVAAVQDRPEIHQDHVVGISGRRKLVGSAALLAFLANSLHGLECFAFG